jgi:transposase
MTDDATIRTDAWEAKLSAEQRDRIFERLLQKFDPAKLAEWIEKEFQAPPPSRSALYRFRDRWRKDYEVRRNARVRAAILP